MSVDLVIRNGKVVNEGNIFEAGIVVDGGKIVGILKSEILPEARRVIDAEGKYILPGIIDLHVHFRDPGLTYKEDFSTGSAAAAAGGVTTVFDMPNNQPPITTVNALKDKIAMAEKKSFVDFGLFGGVSQNALDQIPLLAKAGVIGYKILMSFSVVATPITDDYKLLYSLA